MRINAITHVGGYILKVSLWTAIRKNTNYQEKFISKIRSVFADGRQLHAPYEATN